jgi:signal transduction histidine kinase
MLEFFTKLFDTSDFPPRWFCGNWSDGHGWLHVSSDLATFGAYMAIPCVLAFFVIRRKDLPFPRIFWLFAAFIFSCGAVHLVEAIIFWSPVYRLSGLMKLVMATISWATVFALIPATPLALALRSPKELELEIQERKRVEHDLKDNQQVLLRLLDLQENERQMVAHDIHDGFLQDIVGAHMHAQSIHSTTDRETIEATLDRIGSLLNGAIAEGRRLINDLRPMALDEFGVVEAIKHLVADEQKYRGLSVTFQYDVQFDRLEGKLEGAIFRIAQESLNNVTQHGQTEHATVQLAEHNGMLHLVVQDQGIGFDPKQVSRDRFGLRGIRERARLFGGDAQIESAPGEGTTVRVKLPIT